MQGFHATTTSTRATPLSATSSVGALTPENVQQMVIFALSALGIQGKSNDISRTWFVDSAAFNHMSSSSEHLHNFTLIMGPKT